MLQLIVRRLVLSVPILLIVSIITFVLASLVPGDPARALLGLNASPEQYAALRHALHLDEPLPLQYWQYVIDVAHGNLGTSIFTGQPVAAALEQRFPVTLALLIGATVVTAVAGLLLGAASATTGRVGARLTDVFSLVGSALPSFWVGLVLVNVFAVILAVLPASGWTDFSDDPGAWAQSLVLPVIALSLGGVALVAKVTRDSMLKTLQQDFIRTLRACGIAERSIIWRHGLRNASLSVATIVGLTFVSFIGGTVLIESVFALPGLGALLVTATNEHDLPVVQGIALAFTVTVIFINLLTDVSYALLNPKVRV